MSDVQNTTAATDNTVAETPAAEPAATSTQAETTTSTTDAAKPDATTPEPAAVTDSKPTESTPAAEETAPATEDKTDEAAAPAEKTVEPVTSGQLGLKGPGLLKSIIPSKKEFWLSDEPTSPQTLNSYLRGEKPEIANPVVAWASQTGKGLLFFNKKGNTTHKTPDSVLPLYDASSLKKQHPHEIAFKLHGHEHVLKAGSDKERDGWYLSLEKAVELGKAIKDETRESEGYKAEIEKLNKPNVSAPAAAAAVKPTKKSTEVDNKEPQRQASDVDEAAKKDKKSRSTSRGLVDRLKGKKEEVEEKREEKKLEKEEEKADEPTGEAAAAGAVGAGAAAAAAPESSTEDKKVEPAEKATKTEESKPSKRASIFGRIGGFTGVKSPSKEKDQKEAELKPDVPPKDDAAPQIPAPATETPAIQPAVNAVEPESTPATDSKPEETKAEEKKDEVITPTKEKKNFLSGFIKRDRSVSPSALKKEEPSKAEPAKTEPEAPKEAVTEPAKTEAPATETPAVVASPESADKAEPTEEAPKEEKTTESTPNKRNSVFGNLGRRASKAFKGIQGGPKKENHAPKTAEKKETEATDAVVDEQPTSGENKTEEAKPQEPQSIGDIVPEAIEAGKPQQSQAPPTVAASA